MSCLLNTNVTPLNYDVFLTIDFDALTFNGLVKIDIHFNQSVSEITLHSLGLTVHSATVGTVEASSISTDEKQQTATFRFPSAFPANSNAVLSIHYGAKLSDKLMGLYKSEYLSKDGKKRYHAVTQMEPTDCRRMIPCWDEPSIKCTFDVTLDVPSDRVALSNMPATNTTLIDGDKRKVVKFARTPVMSTYLLAVVVGEFDHLAGKTKEGIEVKVFTPLGRAEMGAFALDVACRALSFLSEYFEIPYPLPKSDLIAIPDFAAGAMENWGLITYREVRLLIDDKQSSMATKQATARTICHELAHMWFGNLTTMKWWTHLWLNEGFARFTEFVAVDEIFPKWNIWSSFNVSVLTYAMNVDALKTSHPIEVEVSHPDEIAQIFDAISYAKGASVIRMLATHLTFRVFKSGLKIYLNRFQYSNAATDDLWAALSEASGQNIKEMMESWTKQAGYPVVSVSCNGDQMKLKQRRFLRNGDTSDVTCLWHIPISLMNKEGNTLSFILKDREATVTLPPHMANSDWLKLNIGQTGLYRVQYTTEMLEKLKAPILELSLPYIDRLSILTDTFALTQAGLVPAGQLFSLLQAFMKDDSFSVWSEVSSVISALSHFLSGHPAYSKFCQFVRSLFEPLFLERFSGKWEDEQETDEFDALFRSLCVGRLGYAGHQPTIDEAKKRFQEFVIEKSIDLKPDFRGLVYVLGVRGGTDKEWEALLEHGISTTLSEEKRRVFSALGCANTPVLRQRILALCLDKDKVKPQDFSIPLAAVAAGGEAGAQDAWDFVKQNWVTITTMFGEGQFMLPSIVESVLSPFYTEARAKEVEAFFADHPAPAASMALKQGLEKIRAKAKFLVEQGPQLQAWLEEKFQ